VADSTGRRPEGLRALSAIGRIERITVRVEGERIDGGLSQRQVHGT
jgi:hypothetical protein